MNEETVNENVNEDVNRDVNVIPQGCESLERPIYRLAAAIAALAAAIERSTKEKAAARIHDEAHECRHSAAGSVRSTGTAWSESRLGEEARNARIMSMQDIIPGSARDCLNNQVPLPDEFAPQSEPATPGCDPVCSRGPSCDRQSSDDGPYSPASSMCGAYGPASSM